MIRFSVPRSRLGGTPTTTGDNPLPADVDVSYSTTQQQPNAVVHRVRCDKEEKGNR
ncbi:MAG TPA: hypothetical protein VHN16_12040 [Streptosporangiaceae bacterium]|jgi:hypothetical protein|nr:hypothetical protein [Streptosporangiaceae bacterium]